MKKLLLGICAVMLPMTSMAGLVCDARYANNVILNQGCELGTVNNDSTAQVNLDTMFGFADWTQVWKNDSGDALPTALSNWTLTADNLSGSFTIDWGVPPTGDVMFVLKDGQDDPDTYVGWWLDPATYGTQNYAYNTPFLNTTSGNLKAISHGGFYYREGGPTTRCVECTSEVPVPQSGLLMGLGLMLMGVGHKLNGKKFVVSERC